MIAGLSIVADHGLALYGLALIIAAAMLTVSSVRSAETDARRLVYVWVGRLMSAAAAGGSIILIANAVFDI